MHTINQAERRYLCSDVLNWKRLRLSLIKDVVLCTFSTSGFSREQDGTMGKSYSLVVLVRLCSNISALLG